MVCPHNAVPMLRPSILKTSGDVTKERIDFFRMDSIPENLNQCAFNFDALSDQPIESAPISASQTIPQKRCAKCEQIFPATTEYFYAAKAGKYHVSSFCRECYNATYRPKKAREDNIDKSVKICCRCEKSLPATTEYFHANKSGKLGLKPYCKECWKTEYRDQHPKKFVPEGMKQCTGCGENKPATLDYFNANKLGVFGLWSRCKECVHKERKEKRQANLERERARERKNRHNNKEYYKRYKRENRERESAAQKARYWRNRERYVENQRRYRSKNIEKIRIRQRIHWHENRPMYQAKVNKRKALQRDNGGSYTVQDIQKKIEIQKGRCYYCQKAFGEGKNAYHIDHVIPLSRGGTNDLGNLVIACPHCNCSKRDKLLHEWLDGGRLC